MTIVIVSCVKQKAAVPRPAKDLYTSPLFAGMRRFAEKNGDRWFILSAKYGLLHPDNLVDPYEQTLNKMPVRYRRAWAETVYKQIASTFPPAADIVMLAGEKYREFLVPHLRKEGFNVSIPMEGLSLGRQLQYLGAL
jgi:hypothetical protein